MTGAPPGQPEEPCFTRRAPAGSLSRAAAVIVAIVAVIVLLVVLSAVRLLPQLRNPFAETTTVRSQPAAAQVDHLAEPVRGSQRHLPGGRVAVQRPSFLPSFIEGSQTLFIGDGTVIAYVDFSGLKGSAIKVSPTI